MLDTFRTRDALKVGGRSYSIASLPALEKRFPAAADPAGLRAGLP